MKQYKNLEWRCTRSIEFFTVCKKLIINKEIIIHYIIKCAKHVSKLNNDLIQPTSNNCNSLKITLKRPTYEGTYAWRGFDCHDPIRHKMNIIMVKVMVGSKKGRAASCVWKMKIETKPVFSLNTTVQHENALSRPIMSVDDIHSIFYTCLA